MNEPLTPREREVLGLICEGNSTKEIACRLQISFKTAACHRAHILNKMEARNTAELVRNTVRDAAPPRGYSADVASMIEDSRQLGLALTRALLMAERLKGDLTKTRDDLQLQVKQARAHSRALLKASRENNRHA